MHKIKFLTILFIVLGLACNASVLQAKLVERSSKKMPDWIGKNSEDKKNLYFSGSAVDDKFDKARQLAINDALTQAVESLDMTMSVNTEKIISDTGSFIDSRTKSKTSNVRILNTKIKDVYFEKYEEGGTTSYTVHALVEYNKKDYEEEKARLAKEYEQLKQNFTNRYSKANDFIGKNLYSSALPELFENLRLIYNYGINQTMEPEIVAKINDILSKINFKNSFSPSENHSGINANISAYFSGKNVIDVCNKYVFIVKTVNNFSIETVYCNQEGKIDYSFNKISYLKKSNYKLELDLQTTFNLDEDFYNNYSFKNVSDELNFLGNKKKIKLNITSNKTGNDFSSTLKSYLVQNGFVTVKEKPDFILNVNFKFVESEKTELKSFASDNADLFISNADITAELISADKNTQISSFTSQEKGFGKTANKSYTDLLQKASVSIINSL